MTFYVEPNNWTKNIPLSSNKDNIMSVNSDNGLFNFEVNIDNASDPAAGCEKAFKAEYKCGRSENDLKKINIRKEANGKTAEFDCRDEYDLCNTLKLQLDDNGHLTLLKKGENDQDEVLWTNEDTNVNVNFPSYSKTEFKAEKGKNGRNYLKSGEFLKEREWMGSPSGKYRLMMRWGKLRILYNRLACDEYWGPDYDASNLYEIPMSHRDNLGKIGYINREGQLQNYSDDMINYTHHYTELVSEGIGGFNITGTNIGSFDNISTVNDCQEKCSDHNAGAGGGLYGGGDTTNTSSSMSDLCAGIIFNETDQKCNLRSNDIYNEKRIIDDKNKIYLRTKIIDNDVTCPSNINDYAYLSTLDWADFNKNNTDMNYDTKCGLAHFTQTERGNMDSSYNNLKQVLHNDAKEKIQALDGSYNILSNNLKNTKTTLNNKFNELNETRNDLSDWTGEQLEQLIAMNEDRNTNMISQNYKHILWSILAIVIIIGTIRLTKQSSS
jgi:hypothetical protein